MSENLSKLRNIGIIAHIDAGKTTLTERMLFSSGAKHRVGFVDRGTTDTDDDPEEQQRGITIYAACVHFQWNGVTVNLLDTPGHVDFTAEVERCLRVLDGAVTVFSAREGVEAQSETVWRQADKYHVPRLAFINKMDREGADFERTFNEIRERLAARPVALQIPVGQGPPHVPEAFRGIIDLISLELLTFEDDGKVAKVTRQPIPEEEQELATQWREKLIDELANISDDLMEVALSEEQVPIDMLHQVIREATLAHQIQPVFCGSALDGIGVQPLLDGVERFLPSPLDRPPVVGHLPKKPDAKETRKPEVDDPFCGLVFKILPAKTGDIYWIRVYSGELKANSRVLNVGKGNKENVAQLWKIHATKKEQKIDSVHAGDIVGLIGPRDSVTGDTLADAKHPLLLETITFPETVISMAIEPESTTERKKLGETLDMLRRQDPTFRAVESEETGQTLISGMGELHLEVIKHKLLRDYNLDVKVHKPRVSYRETVEKTVEVVGECHRQIGGEQLFAKLRLKMEPFEKGKQAVTVMTACPPEQVPFELLEPALDELQSRAQGGGIIAGFPLSKVKVTITGGEIREGESTEVAFRIAAGEAFEKALGEAGPVLLEPIMRLEISTPEEYLGDFVGDLQQRRAIIAKTIHRGGRTVIEAHAPLAELFGYSNSMRSLSQGRASSSMEPLEYAPAPAEVARAFAI